jgi:uncharacterized protein YcnI/predicted anti-sigma-YlaC factor YlaD
MRCEQVREALSARIDGEAPGVAKTVLDGHLAGCPDCVTWRDHAERVTQVVRLQPDQAPDLTAAVLAAVARDHAGVGAAPRRTPAAWRPSHAVLRAAVAAVALAQALLALPVLLGAGDIHTSREMACFEVALAVGFALVAWRPDRARVFMPVAVVLAAGLGLTSMLDLINAEVVPWHEVGHLAVAVQAALLWALSRAAGPPATTGSASVPPRRPEWPGPPHRSRPARPSEGGALMRNHVRRGLVVLAVVAGALAVGAPAAAHVSVDPREAAQGGFARLAFRVPTESDTLSTTKVEVYLPEESPVTSVSTMPVPGWTVEVTRTALDEPIEREDSTITEVVSVLTWTADDDDAAIAPGEFGEFPVSLGPLPEVDQLVFKALQTYSDGSVVRWIEEPADGAELEHPAPVLTLTAAEEEPEDGDAGAESDSSGEDSEVAADSDTDRAVADADGESGSGSAIWLALVALIAGLAGLALGGVAFMRTRS